MDWNPYHVIPSYISASLAFSIPIKTRKEKSEESPKNQRKGLLGEQQTNP
jgi:hypothetical protein